MFCDGLVPRHLWSGVLIIAWFPPKTCDNSNQSSARIMKAIFYLCVAPKIKSILFPLFYFLFFWGIEVTIQMPNLQICLWSVIRVVPFLNRTQNWYSGLQFWGTWTYKKVIPIQTTQNGHHFLLNFKSHGCKIAMPTIWMVTFAAACFRNVFPKQSKFIIFFLFDKKGT